MVTLRNTRIEDADIIYQEIGCNQEMLNYTGWNPYNTLESTKEFILDRINSNDSYSWVIKDDNTIVGIIGAYDFDPIDQSIEIGYSIFQRYWSKGYATKAVDLACDQLEKSVQTIKAWSALDNIASRKVLENNGFQKSEVIESAINVEGKLYDQVIYERHNKNI